MDEDTVLVSYFSCSSNFDDGYFRLRSVFIVIETALDLVGNVWDNLYSMSTEISAAFFVKNAPVYFTGSNIGLLI